MSGIFCEDPEPRLTGSPCLKCVAVWVYILSTERGVVPIAIVLLATSAMIALSADLSCYRVVDGVVTRCRWQETALLQNIIARHPAVEILILQCVIVLNIHDIYLPFLIFGVNH